MIWRNVRLMKKMQWRSIYRRIWDVAANQMWLLIRFGLMKASPCQTAERHSVSDCLLAGERFECEFAGFAFDAHTDRVELTLALFGFVHNSLVVASTTAQRIAAV